MSHRRQESAPAIVAVYTSVYSGCRLPAWTPSHAAPHTHGRKAGLPDEKGSASPARTLRLGYLARLAASLAAQLHHSSGQQLSVDLTTCDRCCMCGCTPVGRVMRACARVDYLYVDATTWWSCRVHSLLSLYVHVASRTQHGIALSAQGAPPPATSSAQPDGRWRASRARSRPRARRGAKANPTSSTACALCRTSRAAQGVCAPPP